MSPGSGHASVIAPTLPPALNLAIESLPIADLAPLSRKLRIHKKSAITALADAIRQFGFLVPVLINAEDKIISGYGRVEAARQLGMTDVPCIRVRHLDDDALRVFAIAENQLGQLAGWDAETLKIELQELSAIDRGFSLEVTGFTAAKIDAIILGGDSNGEDGGNVLPNLPDTPVSQVGDLWLLGDHRLLCADATDPQSLATLLNGEQVRVVVTDPPYNVAVAGHVTSGGNTASSSWLRAR